MTLEQTQPIGWIIGIIIGVVFCATVIYFDRRRRVIYTDNEKERMKAQDEREDHFKPKTDNICDHCHFIQFNINDKAIPCKRCRHYVG